MRLPFFNKSEPLPLEDNLIEDPERQRARHRLIGATFLVLIGFVGLPLIFDSKPKNHNNDVAIQIIQPGAKTEEAVAESKPEVKEPVKEKEVVKDKEVKEPAVAKDAKKEVPAVSKTLDKGEEVLAVLEDRKPGAKVPAAAAGRFIVQIGAFSSEERVKNWQVKLNEQKVASYIENKIGKDGGKLYLLRSGPYADKAQAEAADKKIRRVGLTPKIIEQKAE
jgi:DedD protein